MPQMVFFVLSVQRILPGRVQHGQLLPGHAGHHCDVAAAGADGQRPAVCIVEDKSGIGPLRPCDVPQPPAVQPYTAAKGKVVVQRKAIVPQAGGGVEDQKIIEPGLHAGVGVQLDANTGMQARFDNLLVLYSASSLRDDGLTLDYDLSFGGGVWLNGGRLWHITWTQGTDSTFVFYDADGRPLSICAGRSYIAMVSSVTGQELTVLDSAGQNALN